MYTNSSHVMLGLLEHMKSSTVIIMQAQIWTKCDPENTVVTIVSILGSLHAFARDVCSQTFVDIGGCLEFLLG